MPNPVKFEPLTGPGIPTGKPGPTAQQPPFAQQPPPVQPAFTPQPKPPDFRMTDTTRYLSAAVYSNKWLRDHVFESVINEKHRAVIASYGVDLATVAGHCMLARRKEIVRDGWIFALTLLLFPAFAFDLLPPAALIILVVWAVVLFDSYKTKYSILGAGFNKKTFDPTRAQTGLSSADQSKLVDIAAAQKGNVVVYGGFSPFVGSGLDLGGWSFTMKVNKGKEENGKRLTPMPVQPEEAHQALTNAIFNLGLDGVNVEDRLYVDGQEIRDDQMFMPHPLGRPTATVDASTVRSFIAHSTSAARHYKCIQAVGWKAELILSIFIRFTKTKNNLFVEASHFLLPPLLESFHGVDGLRPTPTLKEIWELLVRSAIKTPFMFPYSTLNTLRNILGPYIRWRAEVEARRAIEENPAFNYGAITTVREIAASDAYRRYFQMLDKEMNLKIIQRQILDCIIEFLDGKNIDTSDLNERKESIINYGLIVSGGNVQAQSIAVGNQAVAKVNKIATAIGFSPLNLQKNPGQSQTKG
jgi:hypothetical protein